MFQIRRNKVEKIPLEKNIFLNSILSFCLQTDIHGFRHIILPKRLFFERIFWFILVMTSFLISSTLIYQSYTRYTENPTIITMERNYRKWNFPLNALTICFINRTNINSSIEFIKKTWNIDYNHEKFNYYLRYVTSVTNASFYNLNNFEEFIDDKTLSKVSMYDIANQLYKYNENIFQGYLEGELLNHTTTLSEVGLCETFNSPISKFYSPSFSSNDAMNASIILPVCNHFRIQKIACTFQVTSSKELLQYIMIIHSPLTIPRNLKRAFISVPDESLYIYHIKIKVTFSSKSLRLLSINQRKCRFIDEFIKPLKFYSYNACESMVRAKYLFKKCNCIPFFYKFFKTERECDAKGMMCVNDERKEGKIPKNTNCAPDCDENRYFLENDSKVPIVKEDNLNHVSISAKNTATFTSYITGIFFTSPKIRFKRKISFSYQDLLVSYGGIFALFLGCSLLSVVEVIYFFTIKLFFDFFRRPSNRKPTRITYIENYIN